MYNFIYFLTGCENRSRCNNKLLCQDVVEYAFLQYADSVTTGPSSIHHHGITISPELPIGSPLFISIIFTLS